MPAADVVTAAVVVGAGEEKEDEVAAERAAELRVVGSVARVDEPDAGHCAARAERAADTPATTATAVAVVVVAAAATAAAAEAVVMLVATAVVVVVEEEEEEEEAP